MKKFTDYNDVINDIISKKHIINVDEYLNDSSEFSYYGYIKISKKDNYNKPKDYIVTFSRMDNNEDIIYITIFSGLLALKSFIVDEKFSSYNEIIDDVKKEIDKFVFIYNNASMIVDCCGSDAISFCDYKENSENKYNIITKKKDYYITYNGFEFVLYKDNKLICTNQDYDVVLTYLDKQKDEIKEVEENNKEVEENNIEQITNNTDEKIERIEKSIEYMSTALLELKNEIVNMKN